MKEFDWGLSFSVSSPLCVSVGTRAFCCDLISQLQHPAHSCQPHTCMHAHTHLQVKFKTSQCEALWAGSHNCSDIILSHDLMYCFFFFFFNFWLAGTIIEKLCSQEGLVTRWEIAFATSHISYMSFKSFKWFKSHTHFSHSASITKWISNTHKDFWNFYALTHVSLRNVTWEWGPRAHKHTHKPKPQKTCVYPEAILTRESPPSYNNILLLPMSYWNIRKETVCECVCVCTNSVRHELCACHTRCINQK